MTNQDYWAGQLFVYQSTVINNGSISDVAVELSPGRGNEFELYYGTISHNDATASDVDVLIRDGGDRTLVNLYDVDAVTQNSLCQFPAEAGAPATSGNTSPQPTRFIIAGMMNLFMTALLIDDTEGGTFSIVGRIRGGVPVITETGGTPTVTINTEGTF